MDEWVGTLVTEGKWQITFIKQGRCLGIRVPCLAHRLQRDRWQRAGSAAPDGQVHPPGPIASVYGAAAEAYVTRDCTRQQRHIALAEPPLPYGHHNTNWCVLQRQNASHEIGVKTA